jgi:hypothetical protein
MGSDQKEATKRKLSNLLKYRKIQLDCYFDKYYIMKLMSQELSVFNW